MSDRRYSKAIVRPPGRNFAAGLTTAGLGLPDLGLALAQHEAYRDALRRCGLEIIELPADERYPDSTFVEDAAVVFPAGAIITRPGAVVRRGETAAIRTALRPYFSRPASIRAPGTLDGGDICDTGEIVFIGLSERTNESGSRQLEAWLKGRGIESRRVDIRGTPGLLHLKSGIASLGDGKLAVVEALAGRPGLSGFETVRVPPGKEYAANCLNINGAFLAPAGFSGWTEILRTFGRRVIEIEMSEFRKMDGGLSCLSLRF